MGKPAYPLRYKLIALCAAGLLACGLAPFAAYALDAQATIASQVGASSGVASALADQANDSTDFSPNEPQQVSASQDAGASRVAPMLASGLFGIPAGIISSDVALDAADPIVGSFTADGLTYAVGPDGLTLVAVGASAVSDGPIAVPASATYNDTTYPVTAIGPYAFYLSGATDVSLPASVASVDDRAFRSSDVGRIEVVADNPNIASYDGALYSADKLRLLLIPEGRAGAVLLPCEAEVVESSKFSHCSLVDAIDAGEGGAAFASWEGLLYDADGTTLLRVPAGATEITIRDGCTAIAAGAMEGCANLERINAPASVASISPDVFQSVPTIALPAQLAVQDGTTSGVASALADQVKESTGSALQLTAIVSLSTTDDDLPQADPASITVALIDKESLAVWERIGFTVVEESPEASFQSANSYSATVGLYTSIACTALYSAYYAGALVDQYQRSYPAGSCIFYAEGFNGPTVMPQYYVQFSKSSGATMEQYDFSNFASETRGTYIYTSSSGENASFYWDAGQTSWVNPGTYPSGGMLYLGWRYTDYTIAFAADDATGSQSSVPSLDLTKSVTLPSTGDCGIVKPGYRLSSWKVGEADYPAGSTVRVDVLSEAAGCLPNLKADTITLTAQWEPYEIDFDVDSEPGDVDYPGTPKAPVSGDATGPDGTIAIEDPKRPGYVFEGWVIPNAGGTEAVDQDLVYQGADKKWYVDASKLPDYAGDDGRVELTARWTSVISVDVPSSVTFYADLVTQGQESREGAAEGAFGQSKVSNQSEVDLRIVGLESSAVKTEGSTLGADSILKKAEAATPSTSAGKLLSLYPSTKAWTAEELQDPDAVGGTKAATAVDFDLDDILLEKSFKADDFTIAAGGTLNMGYRLNLSETGQQLDYDVLSTLSEGQSASIANVSYCFAAEQATGPRPSGSESSPLYVTVDGAFIVDNGLLGKAGAGTYGLSDIKVAADDLSAHGDDPTQSAYWPLYKALLDKQVTDNGNPGAGPYFQLKVDGVYLPLQLIGICQDTKSDGSGKAGLTFQMRDIYAATNTRSTAAGGSTFNTYMNTTNTNSGGWDSSAMKATLRSTFWGYLSAETQAAIAPVDKYQQLYIGTTFNNSPSYLQKTTGETVWVPSMYEVFGASFDTCNASEALTSVSGYVPFQYMAYQGNAGSATNTKAVKTYNGSAHIWWLRSASWYWNTDFCRIFTYDSYSDFMRGSDWANKAFGATPAFCL